MKDCLRHSFFFPHPGLLPGLLCALCLHLFSSCVKNEFTINFEFSESVNATYKVSYYASDSRGGVQIETAANIAAGKGSLRGITRNPTAVWFFHGRSAIPAAIFFLERGDEITLSGSGANPLDWKVKKPGNDNKLIDAWRAENKNLIESILSNRNLTASSSGKEDSALSEDLMKLNKAVAALVEENPYSPASLMILEAYFSSQIDTPLFNKLLKLLDEKGTIAKYPQLLTRHDAAPFAGSPLNEEKNARMKDIVVQSYQKNIDTLRLGSGKKPHLLYFWTREDIGRDAVVDTLRRILKWRSDSAAMPVASISMGGDSTSWSYRVRMDSLKGAVNAIAMRGLADENLLQLGVGGTPWFVVVDAKGKSIYSGEDMQSALRKFRSLKPKITPSQNKNK